MDKDRNPRKKKFRKKNQLSRANSLSAKFIRKNKKDSRIYENPIIFTSNQPKTVEKEEKEENVKEEENIIDQENDENNNQIIENKDNEDIEEDDNKEDINEEGENKGDDKQDGHSREYLKKKRKYEESKKQYFDDINNKSSKYKVFDNGKIELMKDVTNKGVIKKFNKLQKMKEMDEKSSVMNARAEILLPQESGFIKSKKETFKLTQRELKNAVDMNSARKSFEINLDSFGPYKIDYTSNGNYMAIAGNKGHLAQFNWKTKKLSFELHLNQTVRDVKFLHNQSWLAVAQKNTVNIYDEKGMELHCLDQLQNVNHLEFIKLAWLLASLSDTMLYYKDVSTGKTVSYIKLKNIQVPRSMATNEWNGVSLVGDSRGTITMWGPSYKEYLVKILVSKGPIEGIQVDKTGNYFIASSMDRTVKVYDVRMFKELHSYSTGTTYASQIALSQKNVFAMATKDSVRIYKDIFNEAPEDPYLCFRRPQSQIVDLNFVPYEDVLGIGHSKGISSILVPGSGEPNFDTFVDNPFMKTKQLREHVVSSLLTKIQPEFIQLEPDFIGKYEEVDQQKLWEQNVEFREKTMKEWTPKGRKKTRMDPTSVNRRKQKGLWDQKRELIKDIRDRDMNDDKVKNLNQEKLKVNKEKFGAALGRFQK